MPLVLEPLQNQQDIPGYIQLQWDAFEPISANMIFPMLYPKGLQPDLITRFTTRTLKQLEADSKSHPCMAKDGSTGEILGASSWEIITDAASSKQEIDAEFEKTWNERSGRTPVEGENKVLDAAFFRAAFYSQAEIMAGQTYMLFQLLATSPRHQRRGVGSFLLKNALDEADRLDLPVFLHSGVNGKPLYERFGFEVVSVMELNCMDYGGRSDGKHWCMVRPARAPQSVETRGE